VAEADLVLVLVHDEDEGVLTVEVADFADREESGELAGATIAVSQTRLGAALGSREHMVVDDLRAAAPWPIPLPERAATVVPLATADALHGLLVLVAPESDGDWRQEETAMLSTFAGQAALAFERALAQEEREMYMILEDRERIARDLHDVVIQRLFATGMQLQTAARLAAKPEIAERVNAAVDELDTTIRDIRSAIFELRTPMTAELRAEIRDIVGDAARQLGFRPTLDLDGPLDSAVPAEIRADLLAVLREALSNVVRHAGATSVRVGVRVSGEGLRLRVADDGVGIDNATLVGAESDHHGLANMRARAEKAGGSFEARANEPAGTILEWSVPI
jgi:signal transduction histidine kinase